jgi:hypothetical protein
MRNASCKLEAGYGGIGYRPELIAEAAPCNEPRRGFTTGVELATEPSRVDIQGAAYGGVVVAPDLLR